MEDRRKNAGRLVIGEMLKQVKAPRLGKWRSQRNTGMMGNTGIIGNNGKWWEIRERERYWEYVEVKQIQVFFWVQKGWKGKWKILY